MLNPSRPKAGGALTELEPSFDAPCRLPGTAASAPAARAARSLRYPRGPDLRTFVRISVALTRLTQLA